MHMMTESKWLQSVFQALYPTLCWGRSLNLPKWIYPDDLKYRLNSNLYVVLGIL